LWPKTNDPRRRWWWWWIFLADALAEKEQNTSRES
jgi:hypothetical protein